MIEEITRANREEFSRRYQGTYGFLTSDSGKKQIVTVAEVGSVYTEVHGIDRTPYRLNNDTGCTLEFTQVPSQWFQPDDDHIVYVCRRPERMWKRGICPDNTNMFVPNKGKLEMISVKADRVSQIFHPDKDVEAFDDITKIKCGLWSRLIAWADTTVFVKDVPVGTVDHERKLVMLDKVQFQQEVRDALVRSNSDYSVAGV